MSANDELQAHTCEKMLEFYGDVANNVAQGNSQQLTEQWKNGELERGWYYIKKLLKNRVVMDFYYGNDVDRWMDNYDEEIKEVLAQVPSYKEWKQLHKFLEEFNALDVAEDNKKLKELLKQWMYFYPIILYEHEDTLKTKDIVELFDKTANAIGEKK